MQRDLPAVHNVRLKSGYLFGYQWKVAELGPELPSSNSISFQIAEKCNLTSLSTHDAGILLKGFIALIHRS